MRTPSQPQRILSNGHVDALTEQRVHELAQHFIDLDPEVALTQDDWDKYEEFLLYAHNPYKRIIPVHSVYSDPTRTNGGQTYQGSNKSGTVDADIWAMGYGAWKSARHLYMFNDETYLKSVTLHADGIFSHLNDTQNGWVDPQTGERPPLFRLIKDPANEILDPSDVFRSPFLTIGQASLGVLQGVQWILAHPEIHNKAAPQIPNLNVNTGSTYLEKATFYLEKLKLMFDYRQKHRNHPSENFFDDKLGYWFVDDGVAAGRLPMPVAWNRAYFFQAAYVLAGRGLALLDEKKYGDWYKDARTQSRRALNYLLDSCIKGTNEYGHVCLWSYSKFNDAPRGNDIVHFRMEIDAILLMDAYGGIIRSDAERRLIANTILTQSYDYDNHYTHTHIDQRGNVPASETSVNPMPLNGPFIIEHIPESYSKYMAECKYRLNANLSINKATSRADHYYLEGLRDMLLAQERYVALGYSPKSKTKAPTLSGLPTGVQRFQIGEALETSVEAPKGSELAWDFDNNGTVDLLTPKVDFAYKYTGHYTATVRVTDPNTGLFRIGQIPVTVDSFGKGTGAGTIEGGMWQGYSNFNNILEYAENNAPVRTFQTDELALPLAGFIHDDKFATVFQGYLHAPRTGTYVFYAASDDGSKLWLSTDESKANLALIAEVPAYTGFALWDIYPTQKSAPIKLEKGEKYRFAFAHEEDSMDAHAEVAWHIQGEDKPFLISAAHLSNK